LTIMKRDQVLLMQSRKNIFSFFAATLNGTTTIPKLFKETFTKEEFTPGFTKSMRNSIYQDLKYNSNGYAFYCHENFEKDFLRKI